MPTDGGSIVPPGGGDPTVTIEGQPAHPQQVPQLQPQQQGVHMPYPGNAYYGGMTMHPAHPRAHHMGGYQQILGGPQQMPVSLSLFLSTFCFGRISYHAH